MMICISHISIQLCYGLECDDNLEGENLIIPNGVNYAIQRSHYNSFNKIEINGTLTLQNDEEINLVFNCMKFSVQGKLMIIQTTSFPITIRQNLNKNNCNSLDMTQGQIDLTIKKNLPIEYEIYESVFTGNTTAKIVQANSYFTPSQSVILISYDAQNVQYQELTISKIEENTITFKEVIQNDYYVYKSQLLPNPKLVLSSAKDQIVFQDICLNAHSQSLNGITFLNPQYLELSVPEISFCIFKYEYISVDREALEFYINGEITDCLFYGFNSKSLTLNKNTPTQFKENLIVNSKFLIIENVGDFSFNKMVNSSLRLLLKKSDVLTFSNNTVKNSDIIISSDHITNVAISKSTFISSTFYIEDNAFSLDILHSRLLESKIKITKIRDLNIENSYVFSSKSLNFLESQITVEQQPETVMIKKSIFKGDITTFICQTYSIPSIQLKQTTVILEKNTFLLNNMKNQNLSSLFQFPHKQFTYQTNDNKFYFQIQVETYNLYYPFFLYPRIMELEGAKMMSQYYPSYYRLSNFNVDDSRERKLDVIMIKIKQNNKDKYKVLSNNTDYIQIMNYETQFIQFTDLDYMFVSPQELDLIISNQQKFSSNLQGYRYQIIISVDKLPILKVLFLNYLESDSLRIKLTNDFQQVTNNGNVQMKFNQVQNQIEIKWDYSVQEFSGGLFLTYCHHEEFVDLKQGCVASCEGFLSGRYCSDQCNEGYYPKQNMNICGKCQVGCQDCDQSGCNKCYPEYFIDDGVCLDYCSRGEYYKNDQCYNCLENCELCNDRQSGVVDQENCSQCEFVFSCNLFAEHCHPSCETCSGQTEYHCQSCSKSHQLQKYGWCLN